MRLQFFSIPACDPGTETAALNRFLASHRVIEVERHFVPESGYWAICVQYIEGEAGGDKTVARNRVDYKEVLNADDFALFSRLRQLRKELAERDGVPVYAVLTNEQLAEIARQRPTTRAALAAVEGIGETRLDRYGEAMINCVLENGRPTP